MVHITFLLENAALGDLILFKYVMLMNRGCKIFVTRIINVQVLYFKSRCIFDIEKS